MRYLSAFAMFRDETKWLHEWLEYHRLVGVEHVSLVTNEPDPAAALAVLAPYRAAGFVDVRCGPGFTQPNQCATYLDAARRAAAESSTAWLAFLDLDEFLVPVGGTPVPELLREFEGDAGLALNWRMFGSSGLLESPDSQIHGFLRRAPDDFPDNRHVKVVVRPGRVLSFPDPHNIAPVAGYEVVDERHRPVHGPRCGVTGDRARVNHYCVRSRADFAVKRARSCPEKTWAFFAHADRNEVYDDLASRLFRGGGVCVG